MTLHRRLTVFFIAIVILPLAAAAFVVQRFVVGEIERRARLSLGPSLNASIVLYNDRRLALDDRVYGAIISVASFGRLLQSGEPGAIDAFLEERLTDEGGLDFLMVLDRKGRRLGFASVPATFAPGIAMPGPTEILEAGKVHDLFVRTPRIPLKISDRGVVGSVLGGYWLDQGLLVAPTEGGVQMTIVAGDQVVASTTVIEDAGDLDLEIGDAFEMDIDGGALAQASRLTDETSLVAWTPRDPLNDRATLVRSAMVGLLLLALGATGVLAYKLARLVTQDLEELTEGARAMAEGRFEHRVPVRSKDEVGQLAHVFNEMGARLSETITELSSSRDQLQRAIRRVGETLRSTHDMKQILDAVLHTGMDAVHADAGTYWTFTPTREEIYPAIGIGTEVDELHRLKIGEGIIGLVAERGITTLVPVPGGPPPARGEPSFPNVLALPLYHDDRIYGVFALYRTPGKRPFTEKDVQTLEFLTEQGAVALENVTLHEEANRLSLTDGLTGVFNRRYLQMQFRQVLATAVRFDRPFSVLMLDLDNFKNVNDTFGHQRGDAILIEFAQRVNRNLREVDTFARYGGEEFVALLSETNVDGATATAEKILDSVRSEPFGGSGETPIELTVSIGVASYPEHADSYKRLVESADGAMYRAKREGRDRVRVSEEGPTPGLKVAK